MVAFFGLGVYYLTRPLTEIQVQEKIVFACFFAGAMVCMGLSFLYHTLCCHNNKAIGRLFAKCVDIRNLWHFCHIIITCRLQS